MTKVRIWDLPTRLVHWALAVLVIVSFVSGKIGGNAMTWHMLSGYAILALILFRLLWGFAGSHYARFATFVRGPRQVLAALAALAAVVRGTTQPHAGHNPLGALSVLALLAVLLLQATTGLFANDDIFTEGPLAKLVSGATSELLTRIHGLNEYAILALVALHLAAVAFHHIVKRDNLVGPMITGDKHTVDAPAAADDGRLRVRALKPGIEGLSQNIRVRSIVGRFLEHSRIFYFLNDGSEDVYLSSADWMARNFFRRIEVCFPVLDPALKRRVLREGLQPYLADNCQSWEMNPDGSYTRSRPGRSRRRSAQDELLYTLATPS